MKVLIVGLGSIAQKHIAALREVCAAPKIYALRSCVSGNNMKDIENIYDVGRITDITPDFIIISNPTSEHKLIIEKLLPFGMPLFIEKPLFSDLGNDDIIKKIEEQEIATYVACNLRFLDCVQFAKKAIEPKRINEVNIYCGSYLPSWRPGVDFRKVYSANADMGGGAHIDLIHEIDYASWLLGTPDHVICRKRNVSSLSISAIDYANFILEYPTFTTSVILNYYRKDAKRTCEIVCEDGTMLINLLDNTVKWNDEVIFSSQQSILDTYSKQIKFFIDEIMLGKSGFNDAAEAYQILKLCLEAN